MTTPSRCFNLSLVTRHMSLLASLDVLRENRSFVAPAEEAVLDQGAAAVESGFLFHQGADLRSAAPHSLRERTMPEPLGMLEPRHGDDDDRRRSLHAGLRILRSDDGETIRA